MSVGCRSRDGSEHETNEELHFGCDLVAVVAAVALVNCRMIEQPCFETRGFEQDPIDASGQIESNQKQLAFGMRNA